jgi:hypothetical protein
METVKQIGLNQLIDTFIDQIIFPGRGYKKLNQNGGHCLDVGRVWMWIGHEHLLLPIDERMIFGSPQRTLERNLHLANQHHYCHFSLLMIAHASDNELVEERAPPIREHHSSIPDTRKVSVRIV